MSGNAFANEIPSFYFHVYLLLSENITVAGVSSAASAAAAVDEWQSAACSTVRSPGIAPASLTRLQSH